MTEGEDVTDFASAESALSNRRSRYVLRHLSRADDPVRVGRLAEAVSRWEGENDDVDAASYQQIYGDLQGSVLPRLAEAGLVSFDRELAWVGGSEGDRSTADADTDRREDDEERTVSDLRRRVDQLEAEVERLGNRVGDVDAIQDASIRSCDNCGTLVRRLDPSSGWCPVCEQDSLSSEER